MHGKLRDGADDLVGAGDLDLCEVLESGTRQVNSCGSLLIWLPTVWLGWVPFKGHMYVWTQWWKKHLVLRRWWRCPWSRGAGSWGSWSCASRCVGPPAAASTVCGWHARSAVFALTGPPLIPLLQHQAMPDAK